MQWLKRLMSRPAEMPAATVVNGYPAAWDDGRPALFAFLSGFETDAAGRLPEAAATLPDEDLVLARSGGKLRLAAGAMDGVLGHHVHGAKDARVQTALDMLEAAVCERTPEAVKDFHDFVNDPEVLALVDPLLAAARASPVLEAEDLHAFARWLACESPDRGPVKMGVALLGLFEPQPDTEALLRLAAHEEFTLYAAVALLNTLPQDEGQEVLWDLARRVDGWGRIHVVERLASSPRPDIQAWLLREGFRNSIMHEYLAYACATGGGLLRALEADVVDDALLAGAGELVQALLRGGPAEDIHQYEDGVAVVQCWLMHVSARAASPLPACLALADIRAFVDDESRDFEPLELLGWTAGLRRDIAAQARAILSEPRWADAALAATRSDDDDQFRMGCAAAQALGLDVWETRFERQRAGREDQWYDLMQTRDGARTDRVLALAQQRIDLAAIATGPANEMGLGLKFRQHSALGFILQELHAFPGKGWPLVEAGLRSPVVRNRNMALNVLDGWGRSHWPEGASQRLEAAVRLEPVDGVRERMAALLAKPA